MWVNNWKTNIAKCNWNKCVWRVGIYRGMYNVYYRSVVHHKNPAPTYSCCLICCMDILSSALYCNIPETIYNGKYQMINIKFVLHTFSVISINRI